MSDTIITSARTREERGTTVTLVYSTGKDQVVRRSFKGLTEDDIVAVTAALAARRISIPARHEADMQQLKAARQRQMRWYADRMAEALYDGMGRWFRWIPERVRRNTLQTLMDYLRDITATWTSELIAMHAEVQRTHAQAHALRLRPAPVIGPRVKCRNCSDTGVASDDTLPTGWTANNDGAPCCPAHWAVELMKGPEE
jgi:hypothetical protein